MRDVHPAVWRRIKVPDSLSIAELHTVIQPLMGRPLGYKAAAITPLAQRDLGLKEPLGGIDASGFRP